MIATDDYVSDFSAVTGWHFEPWDIPGQLTVLIQQAIQHLGNDFIIKEDVAIHVTAVVEPGAIIKGPAIIGSNCFVAAHAYLRGGVYTFNNVSIGAGCEIKGSIIFPNSSIAHFNFIGDSIVGSNVNVEAGAITANHHNDREDKTIFVMIAGALQKTSVTKFGALIGDGSKIGANAVLSPGTILPRKSILKRLELINQEEQLKLQP